MYEDERLVKLGQVLQRERKKRGLTAAALARLCNYSHRSYITHGENATKPLSLDALRKVARMLGTKAVVLLTEAGYSSETEYWYSISRGSRKGLKVEEEKQQSEVFGPWKISEWAKDLELAQQANRDNAFTMESRIAKKVLNEIETARGYSTKLQPPSETRSWFLHWKKDDQEEAIRLWMDGWYTLHGTFTVLLTKDEVAQQAEPYLQRADTLVQQLPDPMIKALTDYAKADIYHILDKHASAMDYAEKAQNELPVKSHPLQGFSQRLIMIDGCFARPEDIETQMRICERMLVSGGDELLPRSQLIEAKGRVLSLIGDPTGRRILESLERETRMNSPVEYAMSLRSQMIACRNQEDMYTLAERMLNLAIPLGWARFIEQTKRLTEKVGIKIEIDEGGTVNYTYMKVR